MNLPSVAKAVFEFVGGWPGVIAILLGIAGLVYGVYARSHPKEGTLAYRLWSQPLLAKANAHLDVIYDEQSIPEPQVITLELVNLGPGDLGSADLDGGFLRLESNPGLFIAVLEGDEITTLASPQGSDPGSSRLDIEPGILKKGESLSVSLLAMGNDLVRRSMIERLESMVEGVGSGEVSRPVFGLAARVNRFRVVSRSRIGTLGLAKSVGRSLRVLTPTAVSLLGVTVPVRPDDREWAQRQLDQVRNRPSSSIEW